MPALFAACRAACHCSARMARSWATVRTWLGCPGLLGCFLLGFLMGKYGAPGAQPAAFGRYGYLYVTRIVINSPSGSFYSFLGTL